MKKYYFLIILALILGLVLTGCSLLSNVGQVPSTGQSGISGITKSFGGRNYGDITLTGGFQSGHFPEVWDLTTCDMTISFTYDANGLVDEFGGNAHAWSALGIRKVGYPNFNPTWQVEGAGVWLATDYEWSANTFDPEPSSPPNQWANHAVWFDRDGVDQWQAGMWGAIDGVTYNTGGTYDVVITLHATSDTAGEAYMTINGEPQGFYVPNWHSGPADLMPAGMTFTGDMTKMQVFYGLYGYGATHSVAFKDINVNGCLYLFEVDLDIKPGSDPNSINLSSKGLVPVAVLTTDDFDSSNIDPETVKFANASPVRWTIEDVDGDGDIDLLFHFKTQKLDLTESSTEATLTGETYGGNPIKGTDTVTIVPKK